MGGHPLGGLSWCAQRRTHPCLPAHAPHQLCPPSPLLCYPLSAVPALTAAALPLCSSVSQEAGMLAVRKNRYVILPKDFEKAYKNVVRKQARCRGQGAG